jgi:hypothetical protein
LSSPLTFKHTLHGKDRHDAYIFLCQRLLIRNGHQLLDGHWFLDKGIMRGEPDIHARLIDRRKDDHGRTTECYEACVIEFESKLTEANRIKKLAQFKESVKGIEYYLVELNKQPGDPWNILDMEAYLKTCLPFLARKGGERY